MALDLRLINAMIRCSNYPLPRTDAIINNISQYKFYTTVDFPSAYHQIASPKEFRRRLSFTSQWGTYSFRRLMFGLRSAALSFQMLMDAIIQECGQTGIQSYQDDIIIGSSSFQETVEKVKTLLTVLKKYNLTLSPKKCTFHQAKINYLGFNVRQNKIQPISSNIIKIMQFLISTSKRQMFHWFVWFPLKINFCVLQSHCTINKNYITVNSTQVD